MTAQEVYEFIFGEFGEFNLGDDTVVPSHVKSQLYYKIKEEKE